MLNEDDEPLAFIVNTESFKGAHFATFPQKLVVPMIKAGTSEKGCCPKCGAPWERIVEKKSSTMNIAIRDAKKGILQHKSGFDKTAPTQDEILNYGKEKMGYSKTIGWQPTCRCNDGEPVPCIVFDPFIGAGTTAIVAKRLGRDYIGIDLKESYIKDFVEPRLAQVAPLFDEVQR